jgi:hypothetical protein
MATKKELFETVSNQVTALCEKHNVAKNILAALTVILTENLAPKAGGASVNIEDVTKSVNGKITEILCSVSGKFLPATVDFFYEDKGGKGINGLKRLSRQAESIRKQHIKTLAATEKGIMSDVLDGKLTPEQGKAKLAKASEVKPDYSKVSAELPTPSEVEAE